MKWRKWLGWTAGLLAVAIALGIASAWAPDLPVEGLHQRWAPPPSQFVLIDGLQAHLRDEGPRDDRQPIVLLHGTSASLHTWDGWAEVLRTRRRVIRVDLPGFGLTGPAPDHDYRMARYVRFVAALYDRLGLRHSVIGGNSLGGEIAWQAALALPDRIDSLILVDAGGYPLAPQSLPLGFRLARIPQLAPLLARLLPRGVVESSVRNVYGDPAKVTPGLVDRYYDLARRAGNRAALVERFAQMRPGDDAARIATIRQPTLILWGGRDRLIPPENAERFARDIPRNRLVMFPALGHVPQEEAPRETLGAVLPFLDPAPR